MKLSSFSEFEGIDFAAFVICGLIGYFVGTFAPSGPPAIYTSILVSYHLFLAWLIFLRGNNKKAGISLSVLQTVLTHAACLALILGPVTVGLHSVQYLWTQHDDDPMAAYNNYQAGRRAIRLVEGLCCSLAGFAVFERQWLFSSERTEEPKPQPVTPAPAHHIRATSEDAAEWNRYVAANRRSFPPGASLKAEYEKWLVARYRNKAQSENQTS